MTPQQKVIAQLLQVSLFKLGDQFHSTLATLKERHPNSADKLDDIGRDVEKMIDKTLLDFQENGNDFSMKTVDAIHARIIEARRLVEE